MSALQKYKSRCTELENQVSQLQGNNGKQKEQISALLALIADPSLMEKFQSQFPDLAKKLQKPDSLVIAARGKLLGMSAAEISAACYAKERDDNWFRSLGTEIQDFTLTEKK